MDKIAENGTLFEVTPGEYHANEVAAEESKRSKIKHHVKPVRIVVDA